MSPVLVDTSVLIDILRGLESAEAAIEEHRRYGVLHSSIVVRAEVLAGMRPHEEHRTRELLDAFEWHPADQVVAEEAGRLGRQWLPSHRGIDTADLLIAATASVLGLPLLTRNVRHFPMFPDLAAPY
ncbi:MAG: VapC toxin family PIN domain ribonuclease [Pseudonocardiales bacterium]|nr:type II toxin-antitoxin system VapC family toxin [Actinomycetota bacterium]PZS16920.1 MAG: VapC toxin family PIN domain ribonuclease [Pseudonocardiales bacterium]